MKTLSGIAIKMVGGFAASVGFMAGIKLGTKLFFSKKKSEEKK